MITERHNLENLIFIRLNPRDDILLGLRKAVAENNIQNAVIFSGVGSVTSHHYHVVSSSVNPPMESYISGESPADIVNINGYVINGRIHAHIIFSNKDICYGGHLEEGTLVLTFAAISMAEVDADFNHWDSIGNFEELIAEAE